MDGQLKVVGDITAPCHLQPLLERCLLLPAASTGLHRQDHVTRPEWPENFRLPWSSLVVPLFRVSQHCWREEGAPTMGGQLKLMGDVTAPCHFQPLLERCLLSPAAGTGLNRGNPVTEPEQP